MTRPARSLSTLRDHGRPCAAYDHARLASGVAVSVVAGGIFTPCHSPKFRLLHAFLSGQAVLAHFTSPSRASTPGVKRVERQTRRRQRTRAWTRTWGGA